MNRCATCQHFERDRINPDGGMGKCMHAAQHGYFYPMERHRCRDHAEVGADATQDTLPTGRAPRTQSP